MTDYRDMPAGPERDKAKAEAFRLAYSAAGQHELADEQFEVKTERLSLRVREGDKVRIFNPDPGEPWWTPEHIEWKGTMTGRLVTHRPSLEEQ